MEGFMYATGFYDIVTKKEAERFALTYEERVELLRKLRETGLIEDATQQNASILGPNASEGEYRVLAQQAESVWKMMDELAENDPNAYQEFVRDAAKAAQEEVEKSRDPHVEGLAPALVLEAQAQEPTIRKGTGDRAADVTRVVAG
ncbi:hypothetical protein VOLCADRAFT_115960, partial [Volvox carteri f. nagariensis]